MFESEKKSPLDSLKKGLYSRKDTFGDAPRHDIHPQKTVVAESWENPISPTPATEEIVTIHKTRRVYHVLFIFSILFCVVAALVASFTFFASNKKPPNAVVFYLAEHKRQNRRIIRKSIR